MYLCREYNVFEGMWLSTTSCHFSSGCVLSKQPDPKQTVPVSKSKSLIAREPPLQIDPRLQGFDWERVLLTYPLALAHT